MNGFMYLVLGPILVDGHDGLRSPGGPTTRAVLASLILQANRAVTYDQLIEDVWGDDGWDLNPHALQSHITRLRSQLGADRVIQINGSYQLVAAPEEVDSARFEMLVQQATQQSIPDERRRLCRQAVDLWRGRPFGDLADRDFLRLEVRRLEEIRMEAVEACFAADLELGRHREVLGSLRSAVSEFPFDERLWEFYLTALRESGRHAEALQAYEELERTLRDELDIDPPQKLRDLRESIAAD
jgi:DNA-binding SARP family transcriptional activator